MADSSPGAVPVLPITLLSSAGFLSSAGARVVDPLMQAIATDFHRSVVEVSVVVAAFTLPYGLNQILLGPVADRYGKLRVLLGALIAYAIATGACGLAPSLGALTVLRAAAGGASAGLIPVALAYIGDMVPYNERQVMVGRLLTGVVIAQMTAGTLGGLFGQLLSWRGAFLLLSLTAVAVAALLAVRLRRLPDTPLAVRPASFRRHMATYRGYLACPGVAALLLSALIDGMVFTGSLPFLAPFLGKRFGLSYAAVGLLLACFGLGALIYTRMVKPMLERLGEPGLALGGGLCAAVALYAGIQGGRWWSFVPVEMLLGLGYFMLHGTLLARVTELMPGARSIGVACFIFVLFVGQSIGALAIGWLIGAYGFRFAFHVDAIGMLLLGLGLWRLLQRPLARRLSTA